MPPQRLLGVLPLSHSPRRQMMQLHPPTRLPQRPPSSQRVQRQRLRPPSIIRSQHMPPSLVVHDHQLPVPVIDPVHSPLGNNPLSRRGNPPLHPQRLERDVQRRHVVVHPSPSPLPIHGSLVDVPKPLGLPLPVHQRHRLLRRPPISGQIEQRLQRVVHNSPQRVVRPSPTPGRRRPVQVRHPEPTRAVRPRVELRGRDAHEPTRCRGAEVEAELFHPPQVTQHH